jgi:hypothetical protein
MLSTFFTHLALRITDKNLAKILRLTYASTNWYSKEIKHEEKPIRIGFNTAGHDVAGYHTG